MRRSTASLLAVLGVVAVLVFVLAQMEETPPGSAPVDAPSDAPRPSEAHTPVAPSGAHAVPEGVAGEATPLAVVKASPPAVAEPVRPEADTPLASLRARVIDPAGTPLAGVSAIYMPSRRQTDRWALAGTRDIDLSILPTTRSGPDGRLALDVPWSGPPAGLVWNDAPDLILDLDGFAVRAVPCAGMSAAGLDLGDVLLEPGGVLTGRVIDERSRPVPDVSVSIIARAPEPVHLLTEYHGSLDAFLVVTTDPMGRFVSRGVLPGRVGYEVIVPGYMPVWVSGLRMESGLRLDVGDIQLERGGALAGRVVDTAGVGVPQARVHATGRDMRTAFVGFDPGDSLGWEVDEARDDKTAGHTATDESGFFSVAGLSGGSFTVYVEATGYEAGKATGLAQGDRDVTVVVRRPARLVVTVVDARTDQRLPDAALTAGRVAFPGEVELAVTPRGPGEFLVAGAGPVENRLEARAPGYGTATRFTPGVESPEELAVTFGLQRGSTILGVLVDSGGQPVVGASVSLRNDGSVPGSSEERITLRTPDDRALGAEAKPVAAGMSSDTTGSFRFDDLMPGAWTLDVEAAGHAPLLVGDPPEPLVVPLEEGALVDLGRVELLTGAIVRGRVVDRDGGGQAGVEVRVGPLMKQRTRADEAGRFEFRDLPPGAHDVRSDNEAYQAVDLAAGETVEVILVMRAIPRLIGIVTAGGAPLGGARIYLREADGRPIWGPMIAERTTHTDAGGRYEIALASVGEHLLSVTAEAGTRTTLPVTLAWDEEQRIDVAFGAGRIQGRVVAAAGGAPIPGARITARRGGGDAGPSSTRGTGRSDSDGRFAIPELWAGAYTLSVQASGFAPATSGPHELAEAETLDDLVLRMDAGAVLSGAVSQEGLEVVPDDMDVVLCRAVDGEVSARTETSAGRYVFEDLPAGGYLLKVAESGEGGGLGIEVFLFQEDVQLGVGERRRLDVRLPRR